MSNGATGTDAGQLLGQESSLSSWAGPYVTDMLGRGQALAQTPYVAYMGPLSAGASNLQQQAFSGLAGLGMPAASTAGSFTGAAYDMTSGAPVASDSPVSPVQQYMNPYIEAALRPQYEAATRQAQIQAQDLQSQYAKAGAYGGSRQGVAEAELQRQIISYNSKVAQSRKIESANFARIQGNIARQSARLAQIGTIASTGQSLLGMSNFGSTSTSDTFTGGLQTYGGGYSF